MTETIEVYSNPEVLIDATSAYIEFLSSNDIDVGVPGELSASLTSVMAKNEIDPSYLSDNRKGSLILAGVAAQELGSEQSEQDKARRQLAVDAVLGNHLTDDYKAQGRLERAAGDKFVSEEVSEALTAVFNGPQFEHIRFQLGVGGDDIGDIADVKVLDIADTETTYLLGSVLDLDYEGRDLLDEHKTRLAAKGNVFKDETNSFKGSDKMPAAWMRPATEGNKPQIFIPVLTAEELIARAGQPSEASSGMGFEYDFSVPSHELVHCIDNLFPSDSFYAVNLALEEVRAEEYSGNMNGYLDVKYATDFILGVHGLTKEDIFPKDGSYSSDDALLRLTSAVGLDTMLDLSTAIPGDYHGAFESRGGLSGELLMAGNDMNQMLARVLQRDKDLNGPEHTQALVDGYVDKRVAEVRVRNGGSIDYLEDGFAMAGPMALSILAIKSLRERYPDECGDYDWESGYGVDNWVLEV